MGISGRRMMAWALVLLSLTVGSTRAMAYGVDWMEYSRALKEAKRKGRPVLLYFFTDQCGYCQKMDDRTFRSRQVVEYLRDSFVSVRIRAERSPDLVRKYMVRGFPTTWFLTPRGKAIVSVPGYQTPREFSKVLEYIGEGHYKSQTLREYLRRS